MELDPTAIAAASVSAFVSDYNIAARPDLNPLAQQRWTELAVWGLLAAACRWRSYRNAADETNDLGKETPEEDSSRQNQHAPTVVALLLVSSQYATLSFGRASLEFLFVGSAIEILDTLADMPAAIHSPLRRTVQVSKVESFHRIQYVAVAPGETRGWLS